MDRAVERKRSSSQIRSMASSPPDFKSPFGRLSFEIDRRGSFGLSSLTERFNETFLFSPPDAQAMLLQQQLHQEQHQQQPAAPQTSHGSLDSDYGAASATTNIGNGEHNQLQDRFQQQMTASAAESEAGKVAVGTRSAPVAVPTGRVRHRLPTRLEDQLSERERSIVSSYQKSLQFMNSPSPPGSSSFSGRKRSSGEASALTVTTNLTASPAPLPKPSSRRSSLGASVQSASPHDDENAIEMANRGRDDQPQLPKSRGAGALESARTGAFSLSDSYKVPNSASVRSTSDAALFAVPQLPASYTSAAPEPRSRVNQAGQGQKPALITSFSDPVPKRQALANRSNIPRPTSGSGKKKASNDDNTADAYSPRVRRAQSMIYRRARADSAGSTSSGLAFSGFIPALARVQEADRENSPPHGSLAGILSPRKRAHSPPPTSQPLGTPVHDSTATSVEPADVPPMRLFEKVMNWGGDDVKGNESNGAGSPSTPLDESYSLRSRPSTGCSSESGRSERLLSSDRSQGSGVSEKGSGRWRSRAIVQNPQEEEGVSPSPPVCSSLNSFAPIENQSSSSTTGNANADVSNGHSRRLAKKARSRSPQRQDSASGALDSGSVLPQRLNVASRIARSNSCSTMNMPVPSFWAASDMQEFEDQEMLYQRDQEQLHARTSNVPHRSSGLAKSSDCAIVREMTNESLDSELRTESMPTPSLLEESSLPEAQSAFAVYQAMRSAKEANESDKAVTLSVSSPSVSSSRAESSFAPPSPARALSSSEIDPASAAAVAASFPTKSVTDSDGRPGSAPPGASNVTTSLLPTMISGHHPSMSAIAPDTLAKLVAGKFDRICNKFIVIDCRYPYEYNGGHIQGAINCPRGEDEILELFFKDARPLLDPNLAIVFHCEFSQKRGPAAMKRLREFDRYLNDYPNLHYPHVYLLEGGYKALYEKTIGSESLSLSAKELFNGPSLCSPHSYVPMRDKRFVNEMLDFVRLCRGSRSKQRMRKTKSMSICVTQSFSHLSKSTGDVSMLLAERPELANRHTFGVAPNGSSFKIRRGETVADLMISSSSSSMTTSNVLFDAVGNSVSSVVSVSSSTATSAVVATASSSEDRRKLQLLERDRKRFERQQRERDGGVEAVGDEKTRRRARRFARGTRGSFTPDDAAEIGISDDENDDENADDDDDETEEADSDDDMMTSPSGVEPAAVSSTTTTTTTSSGGGTSRRPRRRMRRTRSKLFS